MLGSSSVDFPPLAGSAPKQALVVTQLKSPSLNPMKSSSSLMGSSPRSKLSYFEPTVHDGRKKFVF